MCWMTICGGCSGSGACDPCQGYGTLPDSYPNAGDGTECEVCVGDGICPDCTGSGEVDETDDDESGIDTGFGFDHNAHGTDMDDNELAVGDPAVWKVSTS